MKNIEGNNLPHVCILVAQLCPTLCGPVDCSSPGSSVHWIFQAKILEWVAIPFSKGSSWPRDRTQVSCIAGRFLTLWATKETSLPLNPFNSFVFIYKTINRIRVSGFPHSPVFKNLPCNTEETGSIPDPARSLHAMGQLRPCATTTEPALLSPRAATTEPMCLRAHSPQQEKPLQLQWEGYAPQLEKSPRTPQLEKKSTCSNEDPAQPKINKKD